MKKLLIMCAMVFAIFAFIPTTLSYAADDDGLCTEMNVEACNSDEIVEDQIIKDGSRIINTVSDYTTFTDLMNGVLQFYVRLDATFLYDGSSATCIANGASYNILNSNWQCCSLTSSRTGNYARADFDFVYTPTGTHVTGYIWMSCTPNGVINKG